MMARETLSATPAGQPATPTLGGLLRGEIFKLNRLGALWWTGGVSVALIGVTTVFDAANTYANLASDATPTAAALPAYYQAVRFVFTATIALSGLAGIVVAVAAITQEYHMGTIRILLGRGVGRLRLLAAKLIALALYGLGIVGAMLALGAVGNLIALAIVRHSLDVVGAVSGDFWNALGIFVLVAAINVLATMALAAFAAVLGRNQAFGLGVAVPYFLVENIVTGILLAVSFATDNAFWFNLSQYLPGENLAQLPGLLVPAATLGSGPSGIRAGGGNPRFGDLQFLQIDGTHALVTIGLYTLAFIGLMVWLMARRDVKE